MKMKLEGFKNRRTCNSWTYFPEPDLIECFSQE